MHVFLAGATGVLGRRVVPLLVAGGHRVTAMARSAGAVAGLRAAGAEPVVADAFDAEAVARGMAQAAPDVVMHQLTDLGGGVGPGNARIRTEGTRHLVDAARAAGVRRVVAQSIAWAYEPGDAPADEATPLDRAAPDPRASTMRGVIALEDAVRELPEWVVLRYGLLYGPGTWYAPDGLMAERARAGELPADANIAAFVHADDAASAAVAALRWPTGAVNVVDDEPAAGHAWVPEFCAAVGAPAPPVASGERDGWARGADGRYARDALGWAPVHATWRTGFRTGW